MDQPPVQEIPEIAYQAEMPGHEKRTLIAVLVVIALAIVGLIVIGILLALQAVPLLTSGFNSLTATIQPTPTSAAVLFRDEFKVQLAEGWHWQNENPDSWSLSEKPGWLEIMVAHGYISEGNIENLLLRQPPAGNYELETKLSFSPKSNYQIAGLLIYQDDTSYMILGRAFCNEPVACIGDGFYYDSVKNSDYVGENYATMVPKSATVYLRLRREGNTYSAYVSEDGRGWQYIGTHVSELQVQGVGLMAGQAAIADPIPAQFDYFAINELP